MKSDVSTKVFQFPFAVILLSDTGPKLTVADLTTALFAVMTYSLIFGSVSLWVWMARQLEQHQSPVPLRFRPKPIRVPPFAVMLTLATLFLAGLTMLTSTQNPEEISLEKIRNVVAGSIVEGLAAIVVLLTILFTATKSKADLARLGFHQDRLARQLRDGALGFIACVIPVMIMLLATSSLRSDETEHPFLRLLKQSDAGPSMILIAISAVIIAPLKEELMFRVILQSWLEEFCPAWLAVGLSSIAFAAIHGLPDALALIPLAVVLGVLFQRRRSYLAVVIVHALFNLYNLLGALAGAG